MSLTRRSFVRLSAAAAVSPAFVRAFQSPTDTDPLYRKLASDPLRPQYHLLPVHNWMNDPNGPIFFRERYHMFHQYNPQGAIWGNMNWAHATSPDMFHWQHEPIALSPTPGGPDQDGVFSGSAVLDHGTPTIIYTGVAPPIGNDATLRDGVPHVARNAMPGDRRRQRSADMEEAAGSSDRKPSTGARSDRLPRSRTLARGRQLDAHSRLWLSRQRWDYPALLLTRSPPLDLPAPAHRRHIQREKTPRIPSTPATCGSVPTSSRSVTSMYSSSPRWARSAGKLAPTRIRNSRPKKKASSTGDLTMPQKQCSIAMADASCGDGLQNRVQMPS